MENQEKKGGGVKEGAAREKHKGTEAPSPQHAGREAAGVETEHSFNNGVVKKIVVVFKL